MLLSVKIKKTIMCVKKIIFRIPLYVVTKNDKYIGSIIDYSVVTCDENIEKTKTVPTKNTSTKIFLKTCTSTDFYILLAFLLITIALLIVLGIYCYLVKY